MEHYRPKITHLFFEYKDMTPDDTSIIDFRSKEKIHFSEIKQFSEITCKVDQKELKYKAKQSRRRQHQWNIYQISIDGEPKGKEIYCFYFVCRGKREFVEKFQEYLNRKLDGTQSDISANVSMDGR